MRNAVALIEPRKPRHSDTVSKTVGNLNRSGRQKGVANRTTATVKAALMEAFDARGGVAALLAWAEKDETEFYKLWGRLLPRELTGSNGGPITLEALVAASRHV